MQGRQQQLDARNIGNTNNRRDISTEAVVGIAEIIKTLATAETPGTKQTEVK
jgi:hypothetical protein